MRRLTVIAVVAALFVSVLAIPASAQVTKDMDKFTDSFEGTIPPGEICDFEVGISEQVKVILTEWFNSDGDLIKATVHVNGTTVWSGPGGTATEHWSWNGTFDPVGMTFRQAGNVWNVHQNGLVIHDKGLIIFDDVTGDVLKVAGPHEVFFEGLGALCEAIG